MGRQLYIQLHNCTGKETIFRQFLTHISKQSTTLYSNCQPTIIQSNYTKKSLLSDTFVLGERFRIEDLYIYNYTTIKICGGFALKS